jgi:hypothetical protein
MEWGMRIRIVLTAVALMLLGSASAHAQARQDIGAWLAGQPAATALNNNDILFLYQAGTDKALSIEVLFGNALPTTINTTGLGTTTYGPGTPLFVWTNPTGTNAAGQNAGCRFWVGNNPTGTPGANNPIVCTLYIDNLNNRGGAGGGTWVSNWISGQQPLSVSGAAGGIMHGNECDTYANIAVADATNPYTTGAATHCHESVASSNGLLPGNTGVGNNTAAVNPTVGAWCWSADSTAYGTGGNTAPPTWWATCYSASRALYAALTAVDYTGDAASTSFTKAVLWDRSSSASIIKDGPNPVNASTPHTDIIDLSQSPGFTNFANCGSFTCSFLGKVSASGGIVATGNAGAIGLAASSVVNAAATNSGFELQIGGVTRAYLATDGASFAEFTSNANIPLYFGVNNSDGLKIAAGGADYVTVSGGASGATVSTNAGALGVGSAAGTTTLSDAVVKMSGITQTPGGQQQLCINPSTRQVYYANAGAC